jgi:hypothetical protein
MNWLLLLLERGGGSGGEGSLVVGRRGKGVAGVSEGAGVSAVSLLTVVIEERIGKSVVEVVVVVRVSAELVGSTVLVGAVLAGAVLVGTVLVGGTGVSAAELVAGVAVVLLVDCGVWDGGGAGCLNLGLIELCGLLLLLLGVHLVVGLDVVVEAGGDDVVAAGSRGLVVDLNGSESLVGLELVVTGLGLGLGLGLGGRDGDNNKKGDLQKGDNFVIDYKISLFLD